MAGIVLHIPREVTWALHSDFAKRPATKAAKIDLDGFCLFNGHDTQVLIQRFGGLRSRSMRLLHRRLNLLLSRLGRFRRRRRLREDWRIRCRLSGKTRHDTTRVSRIFIGRHLDWCIRDDTCQSFTIHTELCTIPRISQSTALCDRFGNLQEAIAKAVFR